MIDLDAFEERAAIIEFDGGTSRFEAETLAAAAQGYKRHEVLNEIRQRNTQTGRNNGLELARQSSENDLPPVQHGAKKENRPMPERNEKT